MSHFSVLVTADSYGDLEEKLAPFHEFECTGIDDQYVQDVDVTDECIENGLGWYGLENKTVFNESEINKGGIHKYGYAIVDANGNIIKAVERTNPNKKWDWYSVGGRWTDELILKDGSRECIASVNSIDFEAIKDESIEKRAFVYAFIDNNGEWNQRGKMGWFGMDDRSLAAPDYDMKFWEFINSLSKDETVYIVDCHI